MGIPVAHRTGSLWLVTVRRDPGRWGYVQYKRGFLCLGLLRKTGNKGLS